MRPWEIGPPRGAKGPFGWNLHRTLAEIAAGVEPDELDIARRRGAKVMATRMIASKQPRGK